MMAPGDRVSHPSTSSAKRSRGDRTPRRCANSFWRTALPFRRSAARRDRRPDRFARRCGSARYTPSVDWTALPGGELIHSGLTDAAQGRQTIGALLVAIGAPRLRRSGLVVPDSGVVDPDHRLYELLARDDADAAHSRYNSLLRQLISFERALECGAE